VNRSRITEDPKRARPWLVWGMLAVIFCRGPIPWVHRHDTLEHSGHAEEALAWHLRHFHASGDDEHGWHFHWTVPWEILKCPCHYDGTSVEEYASAIEMPLAVVHSTTVEDAQKDCHDGAPPPILTAGRDGPTRWDPHDAASLPLAQTPSSRVTLRALLCVAQC
jgi:hypothetical protein